LDLTGGNLHGRGSVLVRAPSSSANVAYLSAQNDIDPLQFLPSGFLERTKEKMNAVLLSEGMKVGLRLMKMTLWKG
ncbi:UDP-glycosyltransferase, partial [Trifolium medium]|nr:UDP-glycosyltransferase [Trifolium medium]